MTDRIQQYIDDNHLTFELLEWRRKITPKSDGCPWIDRLSCHACELDYYECDQCFAAKVKAAELKGRMAADAYIRTKHPEWYVLEPMAPRDDFEAFHSQLKYQNAYELTLTTTVNDVKALDGWLTTILDSRQFTCAAHCRAIELTKTGMPHIHALLFSKSKYLNASKIRDSLKFPYRYTLSKVRDLRKYYEYIRKDLLDDATVRYCVLNGVEQYVQAIK